MAQVKKNRGQGQVAPRMDSAHRLVLQGGDSVIHSALESQKLARRCVEG